MSPLQTSTRGGMSDPAVLSRVGTMVGPRWRANSIVGTGGMAAVYLVSHATGVRAAAKVMHSHLAPDPDIRMRFLHEINVLRLVSQTVSVGVFEHGELESGELYLVMELLSGRTLRDLWRTTGRKMPLDLVLRIVDIFLEGLGTCHSLGVVHCDIKPANIFVTRDDRVKLLDFGIARLFREKTDLDGPALALGTPQYMAPEQARGQLAIIDPRTDVFAVGAMIHALATGRRINPGKSDSESLDWAARTPSRCLPEAVVGLPVALVNLIDQAVAWDPADRFPDAQALRAAIRDLLSRWPDLGPIVKSPEVSSDGKPAAPSDRLGETPSESRSRRRGLAGEFVDLFRMLHGLADGILLADDEVWAELFEVISRAFQADPTPLVIHVNSWGLSFAGDLIMKSNDPLEPRVMGLFEAGLRRIEFYDGVTLDDVRDVIMLLLEPKMLNASERDEVVTQWVKKSSDGTNLQFVDPVADEGDYPWAPDPVEVVLVESQLLRAGSFWDDAESERCARLRSKAMLHERALELAMAGAMMETPDDWYRRYSSTLLDLYGSGPGLRLDEAAMSALHGQVSSGDPVGNIGDALLIFDHLWDELGLAAGAPVPSWFADAVTGLFGTADRLVELAAPPSSSRHGAGRLFKVLTLLRPESVPEVLKAVASIDKPGPRKQLLEFAVRVAPLAPEKVAAAAIGGLPVDVLSPVLRCLAEHDDGTCREALRSVAQKASGVVQVEARIYASDNPAKLVEEVGSLLENTDYQTRMFAIRASVRHKLQAAWRTMAKVARGASMHERSETERRELFSALLVLGGDDGASVVLDILRKGGVFSSDAREATRCLAAEALGEHSQSEKVLEQLREIAHARWGIGGETREAIGRAVAAMESRLAASGSALKGGDRGGT